MKGSRLSWRRGRCFSLTLCFGFVLLATHPVAAKTCAGDCDGNGSVTIDELVTGVNIALGALPSDACTAFDSSGDGRVTIDELVAGVTGALCGCGQTCQTAPTRTPTPMPTPVMGAACDLTVSDWTVWVTNQGVGIDTVSVLRRKTPTPGPMFREANGRFEPKHGEEEPAWEVVATIPVGRAPHNLVFSPDGRFAYVANLGAPPTNGSVSVIDTEAYEVIATVEAGVRTHGVRSTPDGNFIWVANVGSDDLTIIDANTLQAEPERLPVGDGPALVAFLPDGSKAYVSNGGDGTTSVVDVASRKVIKTITTGLGAMGLVVTPDGGLVFETEGIDNRVSAIDTRTDTVIKVLTFDNTLLEAHGLAIAGDELLITNRTGNSLSFVDTRTLEKVASIAVPGRPDIIAVSPDCDRAYLTLRDAPALAVVDIADRRYIDLVSLGAGDVHGIAVLPASKTSQ